MKIRKRKLHSLKRNMMFKISKMRLNGINSKFLSKIPLKPASIALAAVLSAGVPTFAHADEAKEINIDNNDKLGLTDEVTPSFETPIELDTNTEITDETNNVTFTNSETKEDIKEENTEVKEDVKEENTEVKEDIKDENTEVKEDVKEENTEVKEDVIEKAEENKNYMDVESVRPGVNVSENEEETKVVMPSDTTYVVFEDEDNNQVIWNKESLGNDNQEKFVNNYNNLSDKKLNNYVFTDGNNIVYKSYAKDESGNYIYNEDGTISIIEKKFGTLETKENGELIFTGIKNILVTFGTNVAKEVLDPNDHYDKPVNDEPKVPEEPTPEEPEIPNEPEESFTPSETKARQTHLAQTGDYTHMVINGLAAVVLASGLILIGSAARTYQNSEEKKLILK